MKRWRKSYNRRIIIFLILLISIFSFSFNLFNYPYFEQDETTYLARAWSLIKYGKLAPYTYWYDHAPAGWMQMAVWLLLTGGPFTFGFSVNSGRSFMIIIFLVNNLFLLWFSKKLTRSYLPGIISIIILSFSPLSLYFMRRVLLDNIMIMWIWITLYFLLKEKLRLSHIILSGISFAIAVLTKETAIFLFPAFLYIVLIRAHIYHRRFAVSKWIISFFSILLIYILYAFLKGELFPPGFLPNDNKDHVSLISTAAYQMQRGKFYPFWDKRSSFFTNFIDWTETDPFIILGGFLSISYIVILALSKKKLRYLVYITAALLLFFIRGKLIIDFYIIALLPFLAINIGLSIYFLVRFVSKKINKYKYLSIEKFLTLNILLFLVFFYINYNPYAWTKNETKNQIKAIEYIKKNLKEDDKIVIDMYAFLDLREKRNSNDKNFPYSDWFYKVALDKEVQRKYQNDWKNIDYILITHESLKQFRTNPNIDFVKQAFINSDLITKWTEESTSYIDLEKFISTNGDWAALYKVKSPEEIMLHSSWKFYKNNFLVSYGRIIDPKSGNTTSEGQSYALLRAVLLNDKESFDNIWSWTRDHLQFRNEDKLFSWLWGEKDSTQQVLDSTTASDADQDIALSLIIAYYRWKDPSYLNSAKVIIRDIWNKEVVKIKGRYYIIAGSDSKRNNLYIINPSYISPAHYRLFAKFDKNPWDRLILDSYELLNKIQSQYLLPPNWIIIDSKSGEILNAKSIIPDKDANNYGFDSFRIVWRIYLDYFWFQDVQAKKYLTNIAKFFEKEWKTNQKVYAVYKTDGTRLAEFESLSTYSAPILSLKIANPELSRILYKKHIEETFDFIEGTWKNKDNYYDQNWAWFTLFFYTQEFKI